MPVSGSLWLYMEDEFEVWVEMGSPERGKESMAGPGLG